MKVDILGSLIDCMGIDECLERIEKIIQEGGNHQVVTANPEIIYSAQNDRELNNIINNASLVTLDGEGVVWAARFLGKSVTGRVTGIDLMTALLERAREKGWNCYFLGGKPGIAELAVQNLTQRYPGLKVAGYQHGYLPEEVQIELAEEICRARPDILFVALGAPRQEKWIRQYIEKTRATVAMGIGGSLDVFAGKVTRAPLWFQNHRLEWAYRLFKEPWRIRRQIKLPLFVLSVIKQKWLSTFRWN